MNLVILGPPASGKGTQAKKLSEQFNLAHMEMGSILRSIAKGESPIGEKVKNLIDRGILVPDDIIKEVLSDCLKGIGRGRGRMEGWIFDGFPRTLSQAEYFEKFLEEKEKKVDLVIYLTLPREIIIKRLINRRTCEVCGEVFNLMTKPPKTPGRCDKCNGKLIMRKDETSKAIKTRLLLFEEETKPVVEFYGKKGILEEVDGTPSIENIFIDIIGRLRKKGLING